MAPHGLLIFSASVIFFCHWSQPEAILRNSDSAGGLVSGGWAYARVRRARSILGRLRLHSHPANTLVRSTFNLAYFTTTIPSQVVCSANHYFMERISQQ